MQQLSLFRGVHDTQPRPVTLEELVTMMRTDQSVRDLTEKHRYARSTGDEHGAGRYKKMMTSFGVAALFEGGRRQQHIVELTGLSLADFDHIPKENIPSILEKVRSDEHTLLAYTTISGEGVRVLAKYVLNDDDNLRASLGNNVRRPKGPKATPSAPQSYARPSINRGTVSGALSHPEGEHQQTPPLFIEGVPNGRGSSKRSAEQYKQSFMTINAYYENLTGLLSDGQCKNVGRISTIAYDEELYYNPDATPFIVKLEEKKTVGRPRGGEE